MSAVATVRPCGSFFLRCFRSIGVCHTSALLLGLGFLSACSPGGTAREIQTETDPVNTGGTGVVGNNTGGNATVGDLCEGAQGAECGLADDIENAEAPLGCGNGVRDEDEACDDGNKESGDGCSANCLLAEPGFSCSQEGQPCRQIARCGDGLVAETEQCDDGNAESGDGCSDRCRVELGSKCEGTPSVCTDAICGNNVREGAEGCDDGNTDPFDGCSPNCLKEPNCAGTSCTSECGDGLIINEECDDGNTIDGDGCSSSCTRELGFVCESVAVCEEIGGQCALRVPAIFRDFSGAHPDFDFSAGGPGGPCTDLVLGTVQPNLDDNGRPVLNPNANLTAACMSTPANFAEWYTDNGNNQKLVSEVLLFDNGEGGYVNRFGAEGQQFTAVEQGTERNPTASLAACGNACVNEAREGQGMFQGQGNLRCNDLCRQFTPGDNQPLTQQLNQANNALTQAQAALAQAEAAAVPDEEAIAELEDDVLAAQVAVNVAQAAIDALALQLEECETTCETELDDRVAQCVDTCRPCSFNGAQICLGGTVVPYDGNPLFFPVDSLTGPFSSSDAATIPAQYGYVGFPLESAVFPNAPNHNFFFTSEVQYWFKYDENTQATLNFLGDDDVWVFLNGRLAVDLGGIHVPSNGYVEINAPAGTVSTYVVDGREENNNPAEEERNLTPTDFGLEPGNVYTITVFHAERNLNGSSFQLTLAGFEATPSDCTADCGDGILSFGEECDDGENNGGYNECGADCKLGPFCGDGIVQPEFESCDVGPGGSGTCRGCRLTQIQ